MKKRFSLLSFSFVLLLSFSSHQLRAQADAQLNIPSMNVTGTPGTGVTANITQNGDVGNILNLVRSGGYSTLAIGNNGNIHLTRGQAGFPTSLGIDIGTTLVGGTGAGGGFISFSPLAMERMRVANNGFVGINTAAPSDRLHVLLNDSETVRFENLPDGSGNLVVVDQGGNLFRCPNATCADGIIKLEPGRGEQATEINSLQEKVKILEELVNELLAERKASTHKQIDQLASHKAYLIQNQPNPFQETTQIRYFIPTELLERVSIEVYNAAGEAIKVFDIDQQGFGMVDLDLFGLAPGMYIYNLVAEGQILDTKKMIFNN